MSEIPDDVKHALAREVARAMCPGFTPDMASRIVIGPQDRLAVDYILDALRADPELAAKALGARLDTSRSWRWRHVASGDTVAEYVDPRESKVRQPGWVAEESVLTELTIDGPWHEATP